MKQKRTIKDDRRLSDLISTAQNYGINRKTLHATIAKYEKFPIVEVGNKNKGWTFDLDKIDEWLKENQWYRGSRQPRAETLERENILPDNIKKIRENIKKGDQKAEVQTKLLQLEYDKKSGLLVPREEVVEMLSKKMASFAKAHEMLPNLIGKKFGLSDEIIRSLRDYLDQARNALVREDYGFFAKMNEASE